MNYRAGLAAGCLLLSSTVQAIEPGPSSRYQQETENWLQLQLQGQQRSPTPQVATPSEREQSMQRWLDSYKHPIPDFYKQDEGGKVKGN
ncbi:DUF3613 domain-containing protein [Pseudomonas gingeri NCPPB 3146 = LMG 5327]|uniref:DUF3613 domain-containing protein n=2 Tax=Pseudomonas gingeri TaxID=117681 RepID=A0A7Y8CGH7_9PSED|nr:DUF3613 domain-containing protein [Pseudomonas gingeri]NVZ24908.1 DUF3613 domain-containing protein [Pseudomonas gingeri]NVZ65035.1 DUF3613 domain-containing protein [Pseudomonas gingeri]NVZ78455.1 DUF3613 domain-containing protein [Pseudomonas gingeri]NWA06440.1 DUF3613 domain-containing protein [Pseudomonas gingeri]NWC17984.1 DUF3613 domain-containing protein [Pseudomonas gingeri]